MTGKLSIAILLSAVLSQSAAALELRTESHQDIQTALADSSDMVQSELLLTEADSILPHIDSLLNIWYVRNYLNIDEDCTDSSTNPSFPDSVYRQRLESLPTVIEMPYNPEVRSAIDLYLSRSRKSTAIILGLFPLYENIFVEALMKYDLPLELKYLPIIESALKSKAYSRAGAAGMWQFIYSTGKLYGLNVNSLVDDRYDVRLASDAAARHFKDLYEMYGRWDLAISAYNCGSGNVNKAIKRSGSTDFWKMYQYLPRETRGYLPAFIAMNYVMNYYREHNLKPAAASISPATDTLHITRNLHMGQLEEMCGISTEEIKAYNPQYISEIIPGAYRTSVLTLPTSKILSVIGAGDSLYTCNIDKYFPKNKAAWVDDEMSNRRTYIEHKIKNGETLSTIARHYHTTVKNIKTWNNMKSDNIRAGKVLRIYNR